MVLEKIVDIISNQLGVEDKESIKPETSLVNDLDADSLDAVEVIMMIEDEFGIEIPDEDAEEFKNIGDIAKYVESKVKQA